MCACAMRINTGPSILSFHKNFDLFALDLHCVYILHGISISYMVISRLSFYTKNLAFYGLPYKKSSQMYALASWVAPLYVHLTIHVKANFIRLFYKINNDTLVKC